MEQLKHECGVVLMRLLKPLDYYKQKYGSWSYGLNKLYLLMEKQHNRGQEAAGMVCVKMAAAPGEEFMFRERALGTGAITEIFANVNAKLSTYSKEQINDSFFAERHLPFAGEVYMGHLRYSTTGKSGMSYVHPFMRRNNWRAKNLALCANFNMTNVDEIFTSIEATGQHPRMFADTYIMLEQLGHRLDRESERLFEEAKAQGKTAKDITHYIEDNIDTSHVLEQSAPIWDGGYVVCGATGSGEVFSMRDPWGIRPAFWYKDDEIMVLASERPVIQTCLGIEADQINELLPGQGLFVNRRGDLKLKQIIAPKTLAACSFERIYFSRGSDKDIYKERKALGEQLTPAILKAVDGDIDNTVLSFIPNTAESAFYGMQAGFMKQLNTEKAKQIVALGSDYTPEQLTAILERSVRVEKVAWKDIKMRTFIAEGNSRNDLAAHVYDITYGSVRSGKDNLVVIDDSIVRGTTLRESIIRILDRLHPKRIVIVSSSPQVRYPDYYGIDMSKMDEFIAFRAAIELLKERGWWHVINDTYTKCKQQLALPKEQMINGVKAIYAPFTADEISEKMAQILTPCGVNSEVRIVYQSIEGLHKACPNNPGDWYFTGNYPTPGGIKKVNEAFVNYYEDIYMKK